MIEPVKTRPQIKMGMFSVLLVMYTIAYNLNFRSMQLLWFAAAGFAALCLLVLILRRNRVKLTFMTGWCIVVYTYFLMTLLWAKDSSFQDPLKSLIIIFGMSLLLVSLIDDISDVKTLMFINCIAFIFCAVYLLLVVDPTQMGEIRLGGLMENAWNSNDISVKMCVGTALSIYFFGQCKTRFWKAVNVLCIVFFAIIIMYCGSRTGFLMMVTIFVLYMIIKSRGYKKVLAIILSVAMIAALYYFIMNYEPFYNVLGIRIEQMIDGIFGESDDTSFNWRKLMIEEGFEMFKQKPLFGYGINNFRYYFGEKYGLETYSHNNFIEMLVSGGIVGFIIYYSIYCYILKGLWKYAVKQRDELAVCLFIVNFAKLIFQYSSVPYYNMDTYALLSLAIMYLSIKKGNEKNEQASSVHAKS